MSYKNQKKLRKNTQKSKTNKLVMISSTVFIAITIITLAFFMNNKSPIDGESVSTGGDISIIKDEVTSTAKFYPYNTDDTYMEVIAIRATDGSVRTALNTCQVCYSSGRGYYEQDGDVLVCKNCGNRFTVDQIEVIKGGCNPVPILDENKTEDDQKIVINGDSLGQYAFMFAKWKK